MVDLDLFLSCDCFSGLFSPFFFLFVLVGFLSVVVMPQRGWSLELRAALCPSTNSLQL